MARGGRSLGWRADEAAVFERFGLGVMSRSRTEDLSRRQRGPRPQDATRGTGYPARPRADIRACLVGPGWPGWPGWTATLRDRFAPCQQCCDVPVSAWRATAIRTTTRTSWVVMGRNRLGDLARGAEGCPGRASPRAHWRNNSGGTTPCTVGPRALDSGHGMRCVHARMFWIGSVAAVLWLRAAGHCKSFIWLLGRPAAKNTRPTHPATLPPCHPAITPASPRNGPADPRSPAAPPFRTCPPSGAKVKSSRPAPLPCEHAGLCSAGSMPS